MQNILRELADLAQYDVTAEHPDRDKLLRKWRHLHASFQTTQTELLSANRNQHGDDDDQREDDQDSQHGGEEDEETILARKPFAI